MRPVSAAAIARPPEERFAAALECVEEEDYERGTPAASACCWARDGAPATLRYRPYAAYLQLFCDAYRRWQTSYDYEPIREEFRRALFRLREEEAAGGAGAALLPGLAEAFGHLSEMLCASTWCENSFISNDPFALREHSRAAAREARAGLRSARAARSDDPLIERLRAWLCEYLATARLSHLGLCACARVYCVLVTGRPCPETRFRVNMGRARGVAERLEERSPEIFSELNAHIRHIESHQRRSLAPGFSSLRVTRGQLVLCLSAGCDHRAVWRHIVNPGPLERRIRSALERRGHGAVNFRRIQLHDIFETSFGRQRLESIAFDVGEVSVTFLGRRTFTFRIGASLSALGVCTVRFTLDLDDMPGGLSVEDARALQCCICPHSGQVLLRTERAQGVDDGRGRPGADARRAPPSGRVGYLVDVARECLTAIGASLSARTPAAADRDPECRHARLPRADWQLDPDTGWYTYLYATRIDEVDPDGRTLRKAAGFDEIGHHPDMAGLVIEQREARASFDDWRFMSPDRARDENLAAVRSHATDAFFVSEYQAFLYFPDDPRFLSDQYEATVELVMRLAARLKFHNAVAEDLSKRVERHLRSIGRRRVRGKGSPAGGEDETGLWRELGEIENLRAAADEMEGLIARAGMSRYRDHGDLMKLILRRMKADEAAALLVRRADALGAFQRRILQALDEERERVVMTRIGFLTLLVTAPAAIGIFEVLGRGSAVKAWLGGIATRLGLPPARADDVQIVVEMILLAALLGLVAAFVWSIPLARRRRGRPARKSAPGPSAQ